MFGDKAWLRIVTAPSAATTKNKKKRVINHERIKFINKARNKTTNNKQTKTKTKIDADATRLIDRRDARRRARLNRVDQVRRVRTEGEVANAWIERFGQVAHVGLSLRGEIHFPERV